MSSKIIRPLIWNHRESDNVVHADPEGMRWSYYIKPEQNKFQLAYIDDNENFSEHGVDFDNLESAKEIATEHYQQHVSANILPEFL